MIGFYLSWGLTYAWTAKKGVTHQFKKKNDNNKLQHKREKKERGLTLLSLSLQGLQVSFAYYGYAQRVPKNHRPKNS